MTFGKRALRALLVWLALAMAIHALAVWAIPRVVMRMAMTRLAAAAPPAPAPATALAPATAAASVHAVYPPMSTATSRTIVLPSPDLAYALCVYDLSQGPVDIDAAPEWPLYWSVALYAANTDNYLVRNDQEARGRPVHWRLLPPGTEPAQTLPDGREPIVAPASRGLVLLRVLVADRERQAEAVARAQHALRCTTAP